MGFEMQPGLSKSETEPGLRPATPEEMNSIRTSLSRIPSYNFKRLHNLDTYLRSVISSAKEAGFESQVLNDRTLKSVKKMAEAIDQGQNEEFIDTFRNELPEEIFEEVRRLRAEDNEYKDNPLMN